MDTIFEKSIFYDQNDILNGNLSEKLFFESFHFTGTTEHPKGWFGDKKIAHFCYIFGHFPHLKSLFGSISSRKGPIFLLICIIPK